MTEDAVIRAWKDPAYRAGLSEQQRMELPAHPAGLVSLNEAEMVETSGGTLAACIVIHVTIAIAIAWYS